MLHTRLVSAMEKCFLDQKAEDFPALTKQTVFKNQVFAFQLLLQSDSAQRAFYRPVIEGIPEQYVTVREVVSTPADMPHDASESRDFLRTLPGLFPDLLRPLYYRGQIRLACGHLRALWIEIDPKGELTGDFALRVCVHQSDYTAASDQGEIACETLALHIADVSLPEQELIFTQWFHADCLADYYHVEPFSEKHFEICENFMRAGVKAGRNMFLLPLLTPALDTRIGGERTTCQLADVYKNGENYTFGFDLLDRWLAMCARCGVKYYEISHFFTQWGAKHAPKVMAHENGEYKRIFGWETDALDPAYTAFLRALIKSFTDHMRARGEADKCFFHISDEPQPEHLPQYLADKESIADLLENRPIMDALSHYDFYEQGVSNCPIPHTSFIRPFLEHHVPDLWCYVCGGSYGGNMLMAAPHVRLRFFGALWFKYRIAGFLHWGYNFYSTFLSYDHIDPFMNTSGESFVPSGDAFIVYPGQDGQPMESTRMRVLFDAIQDLRAMRLCETLYDHETVVKAIEDVVGEVKFDRNMTDTAAYVAMREKITEMILAKIG